MSTTASESSLQSRLQQGLDLLKKDLVPLADLGNLVEQLERERDQLRRQVETIQAECDRLRLENSQMLHAWADQQFPEEMLDRASRDPGGCSIAEVWQHLENS